jgi:hypothetical protein
VVIGPGTPGPKWESLIGALARKGPIRAAFTERRHFAFRREATVLTGVLRFSPRLGLSLQYMRPEESILIADSRGLEIRDSTGRSRDIPAGSGAAGVIEAILPIMQFDMPALYRAFIVHGEMTGEGWSLEFTPKDADLSEAFGSIVVSGSSTDVKRLEFKRAGSMHVEIDVGETQTGVSFSQDELKKYFR